MMISFASNSDGYAVATSQCQKELEWMDMNKKCYAAETKTQVVLVKVHSGTDSSFESVHKQHLP